MPFQKSVGTIVFHKEKGEIFYLFLLAPSVSNKKEFYFDFPKGHVEKGEKDIETAKRELKEETGIEGAYFLPGFKEWIKYFFKKDGENFFKIAVFFLVETKKKEVTLSSEHVDYKWFTFTEALENITFENTKRVLKKADQFIRES